MGSGQRERRMFSRRYFRAGSGESCQCSVVRPWSGQSAGLWAGLARNDSTASHWSLIALYLGYALFRIGRAKEPQEPRERLTLLGRHDCLSGVTISILADAREFYRGGNLCEALVADVDGVNIDNRASRSGRRNHEPSDRWVH